MVRRSAWILGLVIPALALAARAGGDPDRALVRRATRLLRQALPQVPDLEPYGAEPATLEVLRSDARYALAARLLLRTDLDGDGVPEVALTALSRQDPAGREGGGVLVVLRKDGAGYRPVLLRRHGFPEPALFVDPESGNLQVFTPSTDMGLEEYRWDASKGRVVSRRLVFEFQDPVCDAQGCVDPPAPPTPPWE